MSRSYYKIHIKYDGNFGQIEEADIYRICFHSCDTQHFYEEDGEAVYLIGTDSFIETIAKVLTTYEDGDYYDNIGCGFSIKQISWIELPDKIKEMW